MPCDWSTEVTSTRLAWLCRNNDTVDTERLSDDCQWKTTSNLWRCSADEYCIMFLSIPLMPWFHAQLLHATRCNNCQLSNNYCSVLRAKNARRNCTWNHGITRQSTRCKLCQHTCRSPELKRQLVSRRKLQLSTTSWSVCLSVCLTTLTVRHFTKHMARAKY